MQFISTLCQFELAPECMMKTFLYTAIEKAYMQRMQRLKLFEQLINLKLRKTTFPLFIGQKLTHHCNFFHLVNFSSLVFPFFHSFALLLPLFRQTMYANVWCCGFRSVRFYFLLLLRRFISRFFFVLISFLLIVKVATATIFLFEHLFGFAVCLGGKYTTAANDVIGNNSLVNTFARSTYQPIDQPTDRPMQMFLFFVVHLTADACSHCIHDRFDVAFSCFCFASVISMHRCNT